MEERGARSCACSKTPLTVREWVQLEQAMHSFQGFRQHIVATWLLILGAVCRFCHIQRTQLEVHGWSVGGIATKGKSKIKGQRRSLPWSMPTHLLLGSCEDAMTALRTLALKVKCVGILPDFSGGTWDSMVPSSVPMSLRRFHNFSRCLFREPPFLWTERRCKEVSSYSARRVLPTVGNLMGLSPGDRAALGMWADSTEKDTITSLTKRLKMPDRYADAKDVRGTVVKATVIRHVAKCFDLHSVPVGTWKELAVAVPALTGSKSLLFKSTRKRLLKRKRPSDFVPRTHDELASMPLI